MQVEPESQIDALNAHEEAHLRRVSSDRGVRNLAIELVGLRGGQFEAGGGAIAMGELAGREGAPSFPPDAPRYLVAFDRVVMWRVIDDAFEGQHEGTGTLERAILTSTTISRFLGMARAHTYAEIATGRQLLHYRINAVDAVVDVAAFDGPAVRREA